ncbi:MAG TPA: hypothetical protein VL404_02155 [Candidatus Eisenbacteria bacterium]|nr:hypothetical protein [Candidatus Eisenbacteria bacterium]
MPGKRLVSSLEAVARATSAPEVSKTASALDSAIAEVRAARPSAPAEASEPLSRLETELAIWKAKLPVIFKEPVGRQGMAKHARHWIEELEKLKWTN